jgi:HTH-type transcriptional regulator/antitoxin HigA
MAQVAQVARRSRPRAASNAAPAKPGRARPAASSPFVLLTGSATAAKRARRAMSDLSSFVPLGPITSDATLKRRVAILEALDQMDDPIARTLANELAAAVRAYEDRHHPIPDASPREVVRFLMEQHGLKQSDLSDCIAQPNLAAFLAGRRALPVTAAKAIAKRFSVPLEVLL